MSNEKNQLDNTAAAFLAEKFEDAEVPGFQAEFSPDEAELAGAFVEDALSETDALESAIDLADTAAVFLPNRRGANA